MVGRKEPTRAIARKKEMVSNFVFTFYLANFSYKVLQIEIAASSNFGGIHC